MTDLDQLRRDTLDTIAQIQREYQRAIEPYVKILADIEAFRPPARMYVVDGNVVTIQSPFPGNGEPTAIHRPVHDGDA